MSEVIVALLGLVGVLVTGWLGYRGRMAERRVAERELSFQRAALDFSGFLAEWDGCHADLVELMETTEVDRFMILRAWNGSLAPRWTTAVFQMRQGMQEPISYVHIDLDDDYVNRLRAAVQHGMMVMTVAEEPPSLVRDIYEAEGVVASVWFHLESLDAQGKGKAITYCSFATREAEGLSATTLTGCRRIASRLKGVAAVFRDGDDAESGQFSGH